MATDMEKVEDIYERLYQISLQIEELIERELFTDLVKYFAKKDQLLSEADKIIKNMQNIQASEKLRDFAEKYQKQERKNLGLLTKIKEDIRQELNKTSKNSKLAGAYRPNKENIMGNILDFSE